MGEVIQDGFVTKGGQKPFGELDEILVSVLRTDLVDGLRLGVSHESAASISASSMRMSLRI